MNRQGQPQQRPPNLTANPALSAQYRAPYQYGVPPRNVNVLQTGGFSPGIQTSNHRTQTQQPQPQSLVPQQQTPFIQPRGQSSFAFGGGLGQHQPTSTIQQQQTNGTSNSMPPHLSQTPSLGAPSVSSASEVGLDPNDFPALGSTSANNNNSSSNNNGANVATSYASQAGTGIAVGSGGAGGSGAIGGTGAGATSQPRDFTADDFPALGGQSQQQGQAQLSQNQTQDNHSHPPGLNGFQHTDHAQQQQQHRQNLLGALTGGVQQQTPGMLNIGLAQTRNVHPGFQQGNTEAEKQQQQRNNFSLKLNQTAHAWNSPNANPAQAQPGGILNLSAGAFSNPPQTSTATVTPQQPNGAHPPPQNSSSHLNAPPGVPPPTDSFPQQQQQPAPVANNNSSATPAAPYAPNGLNHPDAQAGVPVPPHNPSTQNPNSLPNSTSHIPQHPQTPAQQVLMSAADRWGLLGLLAMIKNADSEVDLGLSSVGTDLGTMGLDMGYPGNLYSTFITPWADQSAAHTVEPDFHLPACYSVHAPAPGPSKAASFSDETLFFMFYSSPRDALQEVAAQELWNRNWRYHKDLRLWITKESGTTPSQKVHGGESGQYTYWDPENWVRERKDMTVHYLDLEEKANPAFVNGPTLVLAAPSQGQVTGTPGPQQQQQQQVGQVQQAVQRGGSFQIGIAGM